MKALYTSSPQVYLTEEAGNMRAVVQQPVEAQHATVGPQCRRDAAHRVREA